jgi:hypothetical protein
MTETQLERPELIKRHQLHLRNLIHVAIIEGGYERKFDRPITDVLADTDLVWFRGRPELRFIPHAQLMLLLAYEAMPHERTTMTYELAKDCPHDVDLEALEEHSFEYGDTGDTVHVFAGDEETIICLDSPTGELICVCEEIGCGHQSALIEARDDLWRLVSAENAERRAAINAGETYVVCNRILDVEANTYCEFDGYLKVDERGYWTCPSCHHVGYRPHERESTND